MLGGVYGGRHTFFLLFLLVGAGCLWELTGMLFPEYEQHRNWRRMAGITIGLLPFVLYAAAIYTPWYQSVLPGDFSFPSPGGLSGLDEAPYWFIVFVIVVAEVFLVFLLLIAELFMASGRPFPNIGNYLLGAVYIGAPLVLLTEMAFWTGNYGPHRVFGLLWMVWTNDSLAYLVGSRIGRTKLFERISPKKTWEGTLGGAFGALLMAWGVSLFIPEYTLAQWLGIAAVAAVFGNTGDLVESMFKRSIGVKDSGSLFPGHGGFLDRFDAFLFSIPFAWAVLMLLETIR
jgi:phosphatidate cytidylyltransferase